MDEDKPTSSWQPTHVKGGGEIYDEIYAWKDYEQESDRLKAIIARYLQTDGSKLLDIACGTGNHLVHLADSFEITGLDKSQEQLAAARRKVPSAEFVCTDMIDFKLELQYDIVVCLFRSIGYMTKLSDMRSALQNMADHLVSGGLLILEPHLTPQEYRLGHLSARFIDKPNLKISRMFVGQVQNDQSVWKYTI